MKIAIVLGTRPEIIKMSPVIRELVATKAEFFILHTGQHYSYDLDSVFFEQLKLPAARYNLEVGSGSHAEQTAKMLIGVEKVLYQEKPDIVLVEGDTNSVLAGALAASKLHIKVGHIEAGLRSYDRQMPEEINRILTDHCSDYLFAPTDKARDTLLSESVAPDKIYITGNTVVDAIFQSLYIAGENNTILSKLGLYPKKYLLVTLHRQENVDNYSRFSSILDGLEKIVTVSHMPIIYPIHPHSRRKLIEYNLKAENITIIDPVSYLDFIQLQSNASLILTDSGGVQEESCILKVPCVTLRDNTERPETINVGSNILAGSTPEKILECFQVMRAKDTSWDNPFGDGNSGKRIVEILNSVAS